MSKLGGQFFFIENEMGLYMCVCVCVCEAVYAHTHFMFLYILFFYFFSEIDQYAPGNRYNTFI